MKCIAPMIPRWAERIDVSLQANRLIVQGTGRSSSPLLPTKSQVPIQAFSPKSKRPIHLQFANADSVEKIVEFVREHGPIRGKVKYKKRRRDARNEITGSEDVEVREDVDAIMQEQQLFRSTVRLLSLLQAKTQEPRKIADLISLIGRFFPRNDSGEKRVAAKIKMLTATLAFGDATNPPRLKKTGAPFARQRMQWDELRRRLILGGATRTDSALEREEAHSEAVLQNTVSAAHGVLCDLFNRFSLRMFPCAEGAIELPSFDREGILPILYFLLRRDYRDRHHLIKVCAVCAETFKSERGDSVCCGRKCYKRYNDRDRYLRKKAQRHAS
jgi:hypothetical protein